MQWRLFWIVSKTKIKWLFKGWNGYNEHDELEVDLLNSLTKTACSPICHFGIGTRTGWSRSTWIIFTTCTITSFDTITCVTEFKSTCKGIKILKQMYTTHQHWCILASWDSIFVSNQIRKMIKIFMRGYTYYTGAHSWMKQWNSLTIIHHCLV